jgi:hypothetical protein
MLATIATLITEREPAYLEPGNCKIIHSLDWFELYFGGVQ